MVTERDERRANPRLHCSRNPRGLWDADDGLFHDTQKEQMGEAVRRDFIALQETKSGKAFSLRNPGEIRSPDETPAPGVISVLQDV